MQVWCRSCGVGGQDESGGSCSQCGCALDSAASEDSPVGLVFEMRGRLGVGKKHAVCVGVEGPELILHVSAKEKEPTRAVSAALGAPVASAPQTLSPPMRLICATRLQNSELKGAWDNSLLLAKAGELSKSVSALRRVADEALQLGVGRHLRLDDPD